MGQNGTVFEFGPAERQAPADGVLLVPLISKPQPAMELVSRVDKISDDAVSELIEVGATGDEAGSLAHTARSGAWRRVVVVGLGSAEKMSAQQVRIAAANAARWLIGEKVTRAGLWLDGLNGTGVDRAAAVWAEAMALAGFRFDEYRETEKKTPPRIRISVGSSESGHVSRVLPEIRDALTIAAAVNYSRRIAHLPPNDLTPGTLAEEAVALARKSRLRCTVHDAAKLRQMGAGGILAVGKGAGSPPCLIQLEYRGAPRAGATIVLVGKAITFDTGGYSIKPSDGLEKLKFDKCGGTAVLGVMKAAADLKLKCNLVGLIAAAENAISDKAYRPGDILRMLSGKTVEVTNTDAEGRLVLADALWLAQEKFDPTHVINLATLTGGVRIALGVAAAGLMSNDDDLSAQLSESGRRVHERLWRLPLWDDFRELIKGSEADIRNSAGKRDAHAIVGGMFLKEFIRDKTSWAHLDIAAVATNEEGKGPLGKGATGFGVRLLVDFLQRR